ncbi:MAG: hypothetical protein ABI986_09720 [Chloroflexota bacterium]
MHTWYTKTLGDGMTASLPTGEIKEAFLKLSAASSLEAAVFTRLESEGRLHCEVMAYFSPAAQALAQAFDAQPCNKPVRMGLDLLVGDERSWSVLFDAEK